VTSDFGCIRRSLVHIDLIETFSSGQGIDLKAFDRLRAKGFAAAVVDFQDRRYSSVFGFRLSKVSSGPRRRSKDKQTDSSLLLVLI
jgi:hypothetical protein